MNESSPPSGNSQPSSSPRRRFRISRLVLKELRETLRDRRTIITLILMPLLVYPALSLVFKSFLLSKVDELSSNDPIRFSIVYGGDVSIEQVGGTLNRVTQILNQIDQLDQQKNNDSGADQAETEKDNAASGQTNPMPPTELVFAKFYEHEWIPVPNDSELSIDEIVDQPDYGVAAGVEFIVTGKQPWELGTIRLVGRSDTASQAALKYLEETFERVNRFDIEQRLKSKRLPTTPSIKLTESIVGEPAESEGPTSFPLASIVPLILVLMTITGAVYPAIDLTAGERERGTLETLMSAPIPRFGILFSKFLAVLTVATLTAVLNITGMFATVWAFQLDKQFGGGMFGFDVMIKMLFLLILFAAFFSAILLVVTSFAKSFKEAQVYLIPVILLSLGPGLLALAPGMNLAGPYAVCPMINILLLARDVINGSVEWVPALVAVVSTLAYSVLAIALAARIFGSDAILYADSSSLAEVIQRPKKVSSLVPFGAMMLCLILLLPLNFISIGFLSRMPSDTPEDLTFRFLAMGAFLFMTFMLFPTLVALHQRTRFTPGFGLKLPRPLFLIGAVLLGVSLWPIVMFLTEAMQQVYGLIAGEEAQLAWKQRLLDATQPMVEKIRQVRPEVIAISFAIVPAVCEEWFFRGMLQRTLARDYGKWRAILLSAILFGAFHMISNSTIAIDRFFPTALVGLVLGYLAYKSNSIWPGVILHALHNSFVAFLGYYQPQLSEYPWFPEEDASIPFSWVICGACLAALGLALVVLAKQNSEELGANHEELLHNGSDRICDTADE